MSLIRIERDNLNNILSATLPRTSDFHQHDRWIGMINEVALENMRHHKYTLKMPNNGPDPTPDPKISIIKTVQSACRVYHKIMDIKAKNGIHTFEYPLMTVYLTRETTPAMVEGMAISKLVVGPKSYPGHGGTTNSGVGIPFYECDEDTIREMIRCKRVMLIHAEEVFDEHGRQLDHAEREAYCITHKLRPFREKYPDLEIRIEHASTIEAIEIVKEDKSGNTKMTQTPQHLLFTADDFAKSYGTHLRCMPYVKTEEIRQALLEFAISGDFRTMAGTDRAPHPSKLKNVPFEQAACGCWLPHDIALYFLAFQEKRAINDNFVKFMSYNGPDAWGLPRPADNDTITIRMVKDGEHDIPDPLPLPEMNDVVVPLGWTQEPDRLKIGYITALAA